MLQPRTPREQLLAGVFAFLALFPLATGSIDMTTSTASVFGEAGERAVRNRDSLMIERRVRQAILWDCSVREGNGEEGVCPNINDPKAMRGYWLERAPEEEVPTVEETAEATLEDLSGFERGILRRAARLGQCLDGLDEIVPGFQALCEKEIGRGDNRLDVLKHATERLQEQASDEDLPSQHYRVQIED